jgi:hypothetical protein
MQRRIVNVHLRAFKSLETCSLAIAEQSFGSEDMTPEYSNRGDESNYHTDCSVLQCPLEKERSLLKNCISHKGNHELYTTSISKKIKKAIRIRNETKIEMGLPRNE